MKQKLIALLTAAGLCLSLAACTISTPDTVGRIGDVEISSGIYLLSQYQAYYTALNNAGSQPADSTAADSSSASASADTAASGSAASDSAAASASASSSPDYSGMTAKEFGRQTITVADESTGENKDWLVSDYIAAETLKNLQYYAAVKTRFAALGGELTQDEIDAADSTAQSIWSGNSALYEKNGFGLATIQEYEYTLTMADDLLTLVYGPDGETPVSDADLTDYAENTLIYGYDVSVPLYDTSTYAMDDTKTASAVAACQAAIDDYNALQASGTGSTVADNFKSALSAHLADAYAAIGNTFSEDSLSLSGSFLTEDNLSSYYSEDEAAQIRGTAVGDALLLQNGYTCELFVRDDPLSAQTLDDIRSTVLSDMKGTELKDSLYAYGADTLENALDTSAMAKLPLKNVVMSLASSAA
jgi:hypothetical protein